MIRSQEIWFWQLIISPHMAGLARTLAEMGHKVIYVAAEPMSKTRAAQGWQPPSLGNAELHLASTPASALELARASPEQAIHICQGLRGNGHINRVQRLLARLGRKQWVVMETVEDSGWRGFFKRLVYRRLFARLQPDLQGILATGYRMPSWVVGRGVRIEKVFPFAYFLSDDLQDLAPKTTFRHGGVSYRFLFVGQLVKGKGLDLLIDAIAGLQNKEIELVVVGSGPLEQELKDKAERQLSSKIDWIGALPMVEVRQQMLSAECLVLPSRYDGWGAVVSEALMAGTPVICSDNCGAAEVVHASGVGGVFVAKDVDSLTEQLAMQCAVGGLSAQDRKELSEWARCLGSTAGAKYLIDILECQLRNLCRPIPPWLQNAD